MAGRLCPNFVGKSVALGTVVGHFADGGMEYVEIQLTLGLGPGEEVAELVEAIVEAVGRFELDGFSLLAGSYGSWFLTRFIPLGARLWQESK